MPRAFLLGHMLRRIGGGNAAARLWARDSTLALREKAKGWQGLFVYVSAIFDHFCLFLLGQYHWFWRREFNTLCQFRQIHFEGHRSQCFCFLAQSYFRWPLSLKKSLGCSMRSLASSHVKILSSIKRCHLLRRTFASRMETFQWAEKARSPAKQNVNGRLTQLAKDVWSELEAAEKWALVLDAPSLSSSSALLSAGFRPQRIVVPNDSDAPFPSNSASKALVMKDLSLNQFLKRNHRNRHGHQVYGPFSCVYCDFTQCLDGSWRPSQELEEPTQSLKLAQAEYASPLEDSWHWNILRFLIPKTPKTMFSDCGGFCMQIRVVWTFVYSRPCQDLKDLQSLFLGHLEHQDAVLLGVTLAHLRSPQRHPSTQRPQRRGIIDQWQRLRLLLGTLAHRNGLCSVAVERLELKGVATEFWLLGIPGSKRLEEALKKQLERTEGMLVWSEIWLRFCGILQYKHHKQKSIKTPSNCCPTEHNTADAVLWKLVSTVSEKVAPPNWIL